MAHFLSETSRFQLSLNFYLFMLFEKDILLSSVHLKGVGSQSLIIGPVNNSLTPAVNHFFRMFKFLLSELVFIFWI